MCVQSALANQAIHPFGVGKLVPAISKYTGLYLCDLESAMLIFALFQPLFVEIAT